jgi:hypothetical protein
VKLPVLRPAAGSPSDGSARRGPAPAGRRAGAEPEVFAHKASIKPALQPDGQMNFAGFTTT